ncbi:MAG TPA: hypothetical protein DGF36_13255 [Alteromonas sp.]|nr:hypothetical protein [Alteromonas sp.]HCV19079.1 hypothetical protein [Alteromonas sp.]|tara:strand:- start:1834 stop:2148 length:315 start_codon:yes stop_codon:yes gene_type:complete
MNWLRLLVVMVAMVGCPAVSTVLHDDHCVEVQRVDLQDLVVDANAPDSIEISDESDTDTDSDGYLPQSVSSSEVHLCQSVFTYQSRNKHTYRSHHGIRAPPSVS